MTQQEKDAILAVLLTIEEKALHSRDYHRIHGGASGIQTERKIRDELSDAIMDDIQAIRDDLLIVS